MIKQFHVPRSVGETLLARGYRHKVTLYEGSATVDTECDTVTDGELADIGMDRQKFDNFLSQQSRNPAIEIDDINARLKSGGIP